MKQLLGSGFLGRGIASLELALYESGKLEDFEMFLTGVTEDISPQRPLF